MKPAILKRDQHDIAYNALAGKSPCVIFCGGFNSNKQGNKAMALEQHCRETGQAFIRFDYQGHGDSSGDFADGSISTWLADTLAVIDELAGDDVILIGSSMGGWLALLAALQRPDLVKGLVLLACAADMTRHFAERIAGSELTYDSKGRAFYQISNEYDDQTPYRIYQHLIDDGEQHCLLDQANSLKMPMQLIHGKNDDVVPWQRSQALLDCLSSGQSSVLNSIPDSIPNADNTKLHIIKYGDHRLSTPHDLQLLTSTLDQLLLDLSLS